MRLPKDRELMVLAAVGGAFVFGIYIGDAYLDKHSPIPLLSHLDVHEQATYTYVNPLLECGEVDSVTSAEANTAEEAVNAYIKTKQNDGTLTDVGVYYRDLNNGPTFNVNEKEKFTPGSLLKLPLVMSLYKIAENDPTILQKTSEYKAPQTDAMQEVPTADPITPGHSYTMAELATHVLRYSDNNAALLMYQSIGFDKTAETYSELGLDPPRVDQDYLVSVRDYARFFRILYNATYLSAASSEQVLGLLAHSDFPNGIRAGVPAGTVVADKFGERHFMNDAVAEQLHNCGIVYKPGHPYVLCIMTKGTSITDLEGVIAQISQIVYQKVGT